MSDPIVQVEKVEKSFAEVRAVDGISFEVRPGEVFALLGPNGAGKSTLVRMLVGILRPDAGEIVYGLGAAPGGLPAVDELGYLPEDRGLYRDMPVARTLAYFGILRGIERRAAEKAAGAWLERLGLADRAADKLETLSKGNQQKIQLAAAVLHRPRFALLDEPFSGLDPLNQQLLRDGTALPPHRDVG
jgi:ABC-2 type transport system ATP-binding protein